MKPETSRKADSIAKAVVADLQSFSSEDEFMLALREATSNQGGGAVDHEHGREILETVMQYQA